MRGITPVIAIILLLLMAVAAAGGFYLVYQQFSASGTESGSSQIQALGETSLSQLTIESVAAGKVYVRNVGASDIDGSKLTVYVDNVPVDVNVSTSSIVENGRATLKFTSVPACSQSRCEVRVSGAATAARSVEAAKLSCASDSDCGYGESCSGGVCVVSTTTEGCGNGVCDEGEYGYSCWEDCAVESLLAIRGNLSKPQEWVARYDWDGETYSFHSNLTELANESWDMPFIKYVNQNRAFATVHVIYNAQGVNNRCVVFSEYDGSSWSFPANLSANDTNSGYADFGGSDVSNAGNLMALWNTWESGRYVATWSTLVNGIASEDEFFQDTNANSIAFAFSQGDNGYAFFVNMSNYNERSLLYRSWNGNSWGTTSTFQNYYGNNRASGVVLDFYSNGDGVLVWEVNNATNHKTLHYGSYDGSSWSYTGEMLSMPDNETDILPLKILRDHQDNMLLMIIESEDPPYSFFMKETNGVWSEPFNLTGDPIAYMIPYEHYDNTIYGKYIDTSELDETMVFPDWGWGVWNGTRWSGPVMFED